MSVEFKPGDRVRYVGGHTSFYVSPKTNAQGTVTEAPLEKFWNGHGVNVHWDERLRYCKETDRREWRMNPGELELIGSVKGGTST